MARIVVLGAGLVGSVMAEDLSIQHEVTCVDISKDNLDKFPPPVPSRKASEVLWERV